MKPFFLFFLAIYLQTFCAWSQSILFNEAIKPEIYKFDTSVTLWDFLYQIDSLNLEPSPEAGIADYRHEYWFALDFSAYSEALSSQDSIYLYPGTLEFSQLYLWKQSQIDSLTLTRIGKNDLKRNDLTYTTYVAISTQDLFPDYKLYLKAKFYRRTPLLDNKVFYFSDQISHRSFYGFISPASFRSQVLGFFFLGAAAVLTVFNLILFFYMREKQYIYYGSFLILQLVYFSQISPYLANAFGYKQYHLYFWLGTISQLGINLVYLLFIRHFLDLPRIMPRFDLLIKWIAGGLTVLIVVLSIMIWQNPYSIIQTQLMDFQRYFMASFAFGGVIFLFFRYPSKLKYFVIAGTIIFTSGALMTMFFLNLDYMIAGSAIESTIFALGLAYKIKVIHLEKREAEKSAFSTKMGALRAQINPHFIFNSLSSIQHLISSGQKEAALSYLTKFSKFVRQVLESSIDVNVSLEKEIELLKVYLDLESLRFDHAFSYQINTPDNTDLSFFEVPMLIVQPFVENALKHGLMPKQTGERKLWIRFIEEENHFRCEIEDNGIGRKASAKLRPLDHRPSRGISITEERLKMVNGNSKKTQIHLEDLEKGTKVIIKLPKL